MAHINTIAIIGATGNLGSAIARNLSHNRNYRLLLMSDDEPRLVDLKMELENRGAESFAIGCAREASWEADIIIVATPHEEEGAVATKIREVATGKIVISISNPFDATFRELATPNSSAAEELQKLLPYAKIVKTFNTWVAADYMPSVIDINHADAFIAGNNGDAVETVAEIVRTAGFNPIIAGDLSVSRTLERIQLLLTQLAMKNGKYLRLKTK